MLCVNKLTNIVFNAKKINAKTQFTSFFSLFFFNLKKKKTKKQKQKQPRMKCMNVMQCNAKKKNKKTKQRIMVTKNRAVKHKDYVRKT